MKQTLILILLILSLYSCEKEEIEPIQEQCTSKCGTVTGFYDNPSESEWSLEIKNECTGNKKIFNVGFQTYTFTNQGDFMCRPNEEAW